MKRLLPVVTNIKGEDTALDATRGPRRAKVPRIISRTLLLGVIFSSFSFSSAVLAASTATKESDEKAPLVALASSFRSVWPVLMQAYLESHESAAPLTSFASSGLLSTQILHGAPFELFLSADQASITRIVRAGKTQADPVALANGTLSLIALSRESDLIANELTLASVRKSIENNSSFKIAIPNPRHAPYGKAAQQALTAAGLWPLPAGSLLGAENASQALQYALSGAANFAIVPTTLVIRSTFNINIADIEVSSYDPVVHHLAILTPAGVNAQRLNQWLKTPTALNIMTRFGLSAP